MPKRSNDIPRATRNLKLDRMRSGKRRCLSPTPTSADTHATTSQTLSASPSSNKSVPSGKRRRIATIEPPRRSRRLNLIIEGELPPEIIHETVSITLADYIDDMLTKDETPAWNAIVTLLSINFQYRAVTTKILSEVLAIECNIEDNPWAHIHAIAKLGRLSRNSPTRALEYVSVLEREDNPNFVASPYLQAYLLSFRTQAHLYLKTSNLDFRRDIDDVFHPAICHQKLREVLATIKPTQ